MENAGALQATPEGAASCRSSLTSPLVLQPRCACHGTPPAFVAATWASYIPPTPLLQPHLEDFGGRDEAGQRRGEGGPKDASRDQGCEA